MEQEKKKVRKRVGKVLHSAVALHAAEKAKEIRKKYGPTIDYPTLLRIFEDRESIRYPVEIRFVSDGIEPGLFGKTEQVSEDPSDGYIVFLHENFKDRTDVLPVLLLYQSVLVNYDELASANDAEIFGAGVLGMERDDYYELIVELTDGLRQS